MLLSLMSAARTGPPLMLSSMSSSKVTQFSFSTSVPSEDLEDTHRLRLKLKVPTTPPSLTNISSDIKRLHTTIATRYVGAGSLISLKTPQEGFQRQAALLEDVREGYQGKAEKVYMLSRDQQAIFQGGLRNFVNFGGHGSGEYFPALKCSI